MWVQICDAWIGELTARVNGLHAARVHRYAPWSVETLAGSVGERHLAVWPQGEAESAAGLTTAPADLLTQSYLVMVWEDASTDTSRLEDDDEANLAWLELHEEIRARLYERDNARLGEPEIMDTRYQGSSFERSAGKRVMTLQFRVRIPIVYT